jgi:mRNA-degrading endonuclease RelE of RelBE toxin-antitoxin system
MPTWEVRLTRRAEKQTKELPQRVRESLFALLVDMERYGPVRGKWPNYGKLSPNRHHCHLKGGKPTYVAVWEVREKTIRLIEVIYVGTHEKAPY